MNPRIVQLHAPRRNYGSSPGVNWSSLKHLRESPAHYQHYIENPFEPTPEMLLGRLIHTLVFEPEKTGDEYAIWEGGTRRGKEWDAFKADADADNKTIFKPAEFAQAAQVATAVRSHPLVIPYLQDAVFERTLFWHDEQTGIQCKGKPDWIIPTTKTLIDLKSCQSTNERIFFNDIARMGYHCQLAHYSAGIQAVHHWAPEQHILIAVEKNPPHDTAVFTLSEDDIWAGSEEVSELLSLLNRCRETNTWPGRYTEPMPVRLPAWVFNDHDDDDGFGLIIGG